QQKIGIIVPSWNTVMEYETQRLAGSGASVHSMRIPHTADTEERLIGLSTQAPEAAKLLAHAKVNVIGYGCTASGFLHTPAEDRALAERIKAETGIPCATSSRAIVDGLRALGAKRLSLASPYAPWLNDRLKQYLTADGFEVLAMQGLSTEAHSTITRERVLALVDEVMRAETEAVFISCSNFRTLEIIDGIEQKYGVPVVTSNASLMWQMLRLMNDKRDVSGAGRLFKI
ncbi:MAG TPA: aspartate/glutamate racemase family protein, partial [Burkholderiales bacterium]|nr:aspartate/glutamate racemase family protein [Burkholderiales bacterium]